eukprot:scaffold533_cov369-Prasinococcus_capsulatus_cf.AAC.23
MEASRRHVAPLTSTRVAAQQSWSRRAVREAGNGGRRPHASRILTTAEAATTLLCTRGPADGDVCGQPAAPAAAGAIVAVVTSHAGRWKIG